MRVWTVVLASGAPALRRAVDTSLEAFTILFLAGTLSAMATLLVNFVDDFGLECVRIPLKYHPSRLLHKACIFWRVLAVAALALPSPIAAIDASHKAFAIQL